MSSSYDLFLVRTALLMVLLDIVINSGVDFTGSSSDIATVKRKMKRMKLNRRPLKKSTHSVKLLASIPTNMFAAKRKKSKTAVSSNGNMTNNSIKKVSTIGDMNRLKHVEAGDRIINGWNVDVHNHPWIVQLSLCGAGKCDVCGGTIVSDDSVLTARHCFENYCSGHAYTGSRLDEEGERHSVSCDQVIRPRDIRMDLALVSFPSGTFDSSSVLALPENEDEQPEEGDEAYVIGWGVTCDEDGEDCPNQDKQPETLNGVMVTVHEYGHDDCTYDTPYFCAGGMDDDGVPRDSCIGDSGGPLECKDEDGDAYLCGVVSKGPSPPDCGRRPGAYVRVAYDKTLDWLKKNGVDQGDVNRKEAIWESEDQYGDFSSNQKVNRVILGSILALKYRFVK